MNQTVEYVRSRLSLVTVVAILVNIVAVLLLSWKVSYPDTAIISPLQAFLPIVREKKPDYEVFGFAPYWNIGKLADTDFKTLTTLAYFGIPVSASGELDQSDRGYASLNGSETKLLLKRAREHNVRTVLTITQMNSENITQFLGEADAQKKAIEETIALVKKHEFLGVNIDFEYVGDPGADTRIAFTQFVSDFKSALHHEIPGSQLSVSVYAASVKDPKLYDIKSLAKATDIIFMMAYDFSTASSPVAAPSAPLTGHKAGKYWYDVTTAVDDFLTLMPPKQLVMGVPWYGVSFAVSEPKINSDANQGYYVYYHRGKKRYRYWVPIQGETKPYRMVAEDINSSLAASTYQVGWDEHGQVPWKAYVASDGIWRLVIYDDVASLGKKYDLAKDKKLGGVGIWALGYEEGRKEMWELLAEKFGKDRTLSQNGLTRKI